LSAATHRDDKLLQSALKDAIGECTGKGPIARALAVTRATGARSLGLIVQPLRSQDFAANPSGAAAAVFIRDPERCAEVETDFLCDLFGLTPVEAAVTHQLASGLSLEAAGEALQISRNTVRAHLRSIFSKSGITRQTELMRLVLNSAAVLAPASAQF
jgi:DNA-binding CsgD family transcriptional regulator